MPAEVEHFLRGAWHQDRHPGVVKGDLAGARQRGRLGLRVVADRADHAAVRADAVQVRMPERVAAAVHARRLPVPHADDPVVVAERRQVVLLAPPHRGGRQVFVYPRNPANVVLGQQGGVAFQDLVEPAQGRTGIAAHERGGAQAPLAVSADLIEQHAGEGLDAGDEHATVGDPVLCVEVEVGNAGGGQCHRDSL